MLLRTAGRTGRGKFLLPIGLLGLLTLLAPRPTLAHPGDLDGFGGHFEDKTALYHYHKPARGMAVRKKDYLKWTVLGEQGELEGTLHSVAEPGAIWLTVPYRPAYQEFTPHLSQANRNDQEHRVKIWLQYVSPRASARRDRKYNEWFSKRVIFELKRKLKEKPIRVQFRLLPIAKRMEGLVFLDKENVNLWMVLSGWSYYLLPTNPNPHQKIFIEAERTAQRNKVGLWAPRQ